ncbi:MAG: FAD-binding protein [Synergistes sp.]|nr:FAD-binding protein [Synergistes sp.]
MRTMNENIYDVIIIGGGAGGLFAAYELSKAKTGLRICLLESGQPLEKRKCPIDGKNIKSCIQCKSCSIMNGIGGAGAFSDGKYNITNNFGGDLAEYIGPELALELMNYVDSINVENGGGECKRYSTVSSDLKASALRYDLHLLDAEVRHLGTDVNFVILTNLVDKIKKNGVEIITGAAVQDIEPFDCNAWKVGYNGNCAAVSKKVIVATGRSGSKQTAQMCDKLGIMSQNNRVDIGVRFECHAEIWAPITDMIYEAKIIYRSPKTRCLCRTFCMNPNGSVVAENTNGIITVNGHSYKDPKFHTQNTNFALLVTHRFTEPFKDSNAYGEYIANLTNMLSGGVMVQRFGDLIDNRRTNRKRLNESFVHPTLSAAEPGNLALALPKQTLDTIIEMIYALDKAVPGTANFDNLLYGTEVKFYNSRIDLDKNLMTKYDGLYIIGDGSGTTHSLSQASAEGVYVARQILAARC